MKRDGGWIATLMAEAENERMHLLTFLTVKQPGPFMKSMVFLTQGVFFNFFWVAYLISPRFCHRLVGYLEEEAVVTYTHILKEIEQGELKAWRNRPAPALAIKYWSLPQDATLADVVTHVRADEAHHR
jgi:ubiquinol oxidase